MGGEMGGMMGGMMGGQMLTEEYLAVRGPDEEETAERRVNDPSVPIQVPRWSVDGRMICGTSAQQRRVFAITPPSGPMFEVGQNYDDSVKSATGAAWSPDDRKLVYSGVISREEESDEDEEMTTYIIRGLFVAGLASTEYLQLTQNKSRMVSMGMGMGGMMGGEMGGMMP